jgi:hypothetical protein
MDYFAGLDISMDETHICVLDREGAVVYECKSASVADAIADELAKAPGCRRIVFETGRMAPILSHAANQPTAFSTSPPCTQLTPSSACERAENRGIPRRR